MTAFLLIIWTLLLIGVYEGSKWTLKHLKKKGLI